MTGATARELPPGGLLREYVESVREMSHAEAPGAKIKSLWSVESTEPALRYAVHFHVSATSIRALPSMQWTRTAFADLDHVGGDGVR